MANPPIRGYSLPTILRHGPGAVAALPDAVAELGLRRPMIVTDTGVARAGLLERITRPLDAAGQAFLVFTEVVPNPPAALVDRGARVYRDEQCDGLIGLGGGSSLDTAKAIGVVAANGGSILDYRWAAPQPIRRRIPPTIAIPTTAGTGSEVTLWAVITDPERQVKFNVGGTADIGPWLALLDPELTLGLPPRITAATGMDALAHAVECYTCDYAQPLTDATALLAMEYVGQYLHVAFASGNDIEARYKMMMAAMLGGMSYGTESAGAAHAMSQSAGGIHDVPHGDLTARLLAPVMEYNCPAAPHKFARIAQALGEDIHGLTVERAAEKAVAAVYRLTEELRIPTLQDLGFTEEEIPHLAKIAEEDPQTIGNPRPIDRQGYEKLWRRAMSVRP
ncbi:MAG: iron-containing alcohol dehydrogenase [Planctomycetes bacterium]|nr:iron-containing alcohol dehydrogenase [Planctomycetota bacterium]